MEEGEELGGGATLVARRPGKQTRNHDIWDFPPSSIVTSHLGFSHWCIESRAFKNADPLPNSSEEDWEAMPESTSGRGIKVT